MMKRIFATQDEYTEHIYSQELPHVHRPVVHYTRLRYADGPVVGERMALMPVDHPSLELNFKVTHTSSVVSFDDKGNIETRNTSYKLFMELK